MARGIETTNLRNKIIHRIGFAVKHYTQTVPTTWASFRLDFSIRQVIAVIRKLFLWLIIHKTVTQIRLFGSRFQARNNGRNKITFFCWTSSVYKTHCQTSLNCHLLFCFNVKAWLNKKDKPIINQMLLWNRFKDSKTIGKKIF